MENETWLPIPQWEGIYEVSSFGRVKRIAPANGDCNHRIMSQFAMPTGYLTVHLRYKGRSMTPTVHKIVMLAFVGPRTKGLQVNHRDGDRSNNRIANLEYVTCSENHIHAYRILNRSKVSIKGSKNFNAKLTEADAALIRVRYISEKISQQSLADEYRVSQPVVSAIILRKCWTHI